MKDVLITFTSVRPFLMGVETQNIFWAYYQLFDTNIPCFEASNFSNLMVTLAVDGIYFYDVVYTVATFLRSHGERCIIIYSSYLHTVLLAHSHQV